jgi:hypothetical protein
MLSILVYLASIPLRLLDLERMLTLFRRPVLA